MQGKGNELPIVVIHDNPKRPSCVAVAKRDVFEPAVLFLNPKDGFPILQRIQSGMPNQPGLPTIFHKDSTGWHVINVDWNDPYPKNLNIQGSIPREAEGILLQIRATLPTYLEGDTLDVIDVEVNPLFADLTSKYDMEPIAQRVEYLHSEELAEAFGAIVTIFGYLGGRRDRAYLTVVLDDTSSAENILYPKISLMSDRTRYVITGRTWFRSVKKSDNAEKLAAAIFKIGE